MKSIEILLNKNVDNLGIVGDVVSVKPGFARNYLIPMGLAGEPTAGNIKKLAAQRALVEKQLQEQRKSQEAILEKLSGCEVTVERASNEQGILFGGVSQHDIANLLRAEGFDIEDRAVRVGDQIKRLDTYDIPIVLASDLKTEIKLWVVSDKPSEELDTDAAGGAGGSGGAGGAGGAEGETDAEPAASES